MPATPIATLDLIAAAVGDLAATVEAVQDLSDAELRKALQLALNARSELANYYERTLLAEQRRRAR